MIDEKFLPLGTVVMLSGAQKMVMISGYLPMTEENGLEPLYDYTGILYPEGTISSNETLAFNHNQINKIYFTGFKNDEGKEFLKNLKDLEKQIKENGLETIKNEINQNK